VLRCPLGEDEVAGETLFLPRHSHWRSVAAGASSTLWALGREGLLELTRSQRAFTDQMVPHSKILDAATVNAMKLHVLAEGELNSGAVVALDAEGNLRAWPLQGGGAVVETLPREGLASWAGLCSTNNSYYIVTDGHESSPAALWRLSLQL